MTLQAIVIMLLVGGIAGWLAALVMRGRGLGVVGNIVVGIVGALIASWLLPRFGVVIGGGLIGSVLHAFIGAVVLLFNSAAIMAMLRHYREDRDFMYGLDIKFLDEARAARG